MPVVTMAMDTEGRAASVFSADKGGIRVALTGAVMDVKAAVIVSGRAVDTLGMSGLVGFRKPVYMACGFLGRCVVDNRPEAVPVFPCMAMGVLTVCAVLANM